MSRAKADGKLLRLCVWVLLWVEDVISQATAYLDIDEARAAAGRLAESRE
jgi:hypothetical protein